MSLIINEGSSTSIPLLAEDTYPAVCNMLVDLGEQYSEKFKNYSNKVKFVWALPGELIEIDGKQAGTIILPTIEELMADQVNSRRWD